MEGMRNDRIASRLYVGECVESRLVGCSRKRWTDTVNDCLKKISLDVRQERRRVYGRNEWRGFVYPGG